MEAVWRIHVYNMRCLAFAKVYGKEGLKEMIGWDLVYDYLRRTNNEMTIDSPLLCQSSHVTPKTGVGIFLLCDGWFRLPLLGSA
jgi:hypothetical protein